MKSNRQFVLCLERGERVDLVPRKVYQVLPDRAAAKEGLLRVLDDSGEDYLYPGDWFAPISLSPTVKKAFRQTGELVAS